MSSLSRPIGTHSVKKGWELVDVVSHIYKTNTDPKRELQMQTFYLTRDVTDVVRFYQLLSCLLCASLYGTAVRGCPPRLPSA